MRRRAGRWLTLALLAVVAAGCGGSTPSDTTTPGDPTSSTLVLGEAELAVCDGTVRMAQGAERLRGVRLRRGAGDRLAGALDLVVEGHRLVLDYAPGRMRNRVRTLGFAVTNITIAAEDFRTTDRYEAAAANVKRRTTALRRAIESFRSWVGCPAPVIDGGDAAAVPRGTAEPAGAPGI